VNASVDEEILADPKRGGVTDFQFPILNRKRPSNAAGGTSGMCQKATLRSLGRKRCSKATWPSERAAMQNWFCAPKRKIVSSNLAGRAFS
jgi:hypothetical protein